MSFFRALGILFFRASAPADLLQGSPFRAFFHLFLFILFVSIGGAFLQRAMLSGDLALYEREFTESFGSMVIGNGTILPEKSPESPRGFILKGRIIRFDYITKDSLSHLQGISQWTERGGILWFPSGFRIWLRSEPGNYILFPLPLPAVPAMLPLIEKDSEVCRVDVPEGDLQKLAEGNCFPRVQERKEEGVKVSFQTLFGQVKTMLTVTFFTALFFNGILLSLVSVLLFSVIQYFCRSGVLEKLTFRNILVLTTYSAVPAVLLSSLLTVSDFTFISPETLFFLAFFFSCILIFRSVKKLFSSPAEK